MYAWVGQSTSMLYGPPRVYLRSRFSDQVSTLLCSIDARPISMFLVTDSSCRMTLQVRLGNSRSDREAEADAPHDDHDDATRTTSRPFS